MKAADYNNGNDLTELEEFDALDFGGESEEKTSEKMNYIEENLWEKIERVGKKISFAKDIFALVKYMRDPLVSWHRKTIVVAALIYFISPIDAVPDIAPLIGYLDDLGVITAVLKFLGHELIPYYDSSYRT
ncbi:MAG TPA: YkvA family protein [Ignavibacteriaceae bacterium]